MGDPEGAIDIYERAIEQLTTLGDLGRLATCHHDCAGLLAVAALGEPGSQYRELRECANHALLPKQAKKLVQALKHACEALRAAELKYGRISTATAQMHYAVGRICRDGRLFSPAIHHLGQASLIYYEVWCGYARMKQHPDVATAVESLQEAIDNYQVRDPKCIDLPRELRDAIDPEASTTKMISDPAFRAIFLIRTSPCSMWTPRSSYLVPMARSRRDFWYGAEARRVASTANLVTLPLGSIGLM